MQGRADSGHSGGLLASCVALLVGLLTILSIFYGAILLIGPADGRLLYIVQSGQATMTNVLLLLLLALIALLPSVGTTIADVVNPGRLGYDCFLSHAWDDDSLDRSTHDRVLQVSAALRRAGVKTWVDTEQLDADQMSAGIDHSRLVLVFITPAYIKKVQGFGRRGLDEACKAEFEYSLRRHGAKRMIAVVLDPACLDTSTWTGAVGFKLGSQIYHNLSGDTFGDEQIQRLIAAVERRDLALTEDAVQRPSRSISFRSIISPNRSSAVSFELGQLAGTAVRSS